MGTYLPGKPWIPILAGILCEYVFVLFWYSRSLSLLVPFRAWTLRCHRRTNGARPGNEALITPVAPSSQELVWVSRIENARLTQYSNQ